MGHRVTQQLVTWHLQVTANTVNCSASCDGLRAITDACPGHVLRHVQLACTSDVQVGTSDTTTDDLSVGHLRWSLREHVYSSRSTH